MCKIITDRSFRGGTGNSGIITNTCRRMAVPNPFLVANKILPMYDFDKEKKEIKRRYSC
jgi:hypothetical protein